MKNTLIALLLGILFTISTPSTSFAKTNVRIAPLGLLLGALNADIDFPVSTAWTIGPSLLYWGLKIGDVKFSATGLGVRANYYLSGTAFDEGFYFGPGANYVNLSLKQTDITYGELSGDAKFTVLSAIFGYQWMWETFNINLGGGFGSSSVDGFKVTNTSGSYTKTVSSYAGTNFALEFTIGWLF